MEQRSNWNTAKPARFDPIRRNFNIHFRHPSGLNLVSWASNQMAEEEERMTNVKGQRMGIHQGVWKVPQERVR